MALYDPTKIPGDVYDTHTHLNDDSMFHDVAAYVGRAQEYRVTKMNVVGYDLQGNSRAIEIAEKFYDEGVRAVIGWQPDDTAGFNAENEALLREQLTNPVVVGVGETGLDYYFEGFDKETQLKAFYKHIELAQEFEKPLTVHMRESFDDVYKAFKDFNFSNFVMHSYSGNADQAEKLLALGGYLSFSGMVTFKKSTDIQEAAKIAPLNKILVETDAPYLAPVPYRGKMNEPAYTRYVVDDLAKTLDMNRDELAKITTENAVNLWNFNKQ
jgi:TatD DNase family protein